MELTDSRGIAASPERVWAARAGPAAPDGLKPLLQTMIPDLHCTAENRADPARLMSARAVALA